MAQVQLSAERPSDDSTSSRPTNRHSSCAHAALFQADHGCIGSEANPDGMVAQCDEWFVAGLREAEPLLASEPADADHDVVLHRVVHDLEQSPPLFDQLVARPARWRVLAR